MNCQIADQSVYVYTGARPLDLAQRSVVFVHGAAMDHSVWLLQSRYFAHHGYNVLAVDLPGHGRSTGPLLTDIEAIADWLVSVLNQLDITQADFCGHSMGALVCVDLAARWPDHVRSIALLGVTAPMPVGPPLLDAAQADDKLAQMMITVWGHSLRAQLGGSAVPGQWMIGSCLRLLEKSSAGVLYNDLSACNRYDQGLERAATVKCPSLLLLGARDQMTPVRASANLFASLEHAQRKVLPTCGHLLMAEQPDQVLDTLIEFIAKTETTQFSQNSVDHSKK